MQTTWEPSDGRCGRPIRRERVPDLANDDLDDIGKVDLVFDVVGCDMPIHPTIGECYPTGRAAGVGDGASRGWPPMGWLAVDFVVDPVPNRLVRSSTGCGTGALWSAVL